MQVYTKLLYDFTQQLQDSITGAGGLPAAFTSGLRPSRNTLICAGATAAACVAVGTIVKLLHGRSNTGTKAAAAPAREIGFRYRNWRDDFTDSDTDSEDDDPTAVEDPNGESREQPCYFLPMPDEF